MNIDQFSDIELLCELVKRNGKATAAHTTRRQGVHYETLVAVGKDNCAYIVLTDDGFEELQRIGAKE